MHQPDCAQIELCVTIANEHLILASEKNWAKAWLQSPIKYRILYEKVEPFIINLPTSKIAEFFFHFTVFICKAAKMLTMNFYSRE